MDAQLPDAEKGAVPETPALRNPNSADMDPPAREIVVDDPRPVEASSAGGVSSTLDSRENEAARVRAVAVEMGREDETIQIDHTTLEKDGPVGDKKEVAKDCPQTEDGETHIVETATGREYENAEITLVVEMNTDIEVMDESASKGEEIMQAAADPSLQGGALLQVIEQMGPSQFKEEGRDTNLAVVHEHTETSAAAQGKLEKVQTPDQQIGENESSESVMQDVDVETKNLASSKGIKDGLLSKDEGQGVPKEFGVFAEAQIRGDAEKPCLGADAVAFTGSIEAKAEGAVSGFPDAVEGVENDEVGSTRGEAPGGCVKRTVEGGDMEKGYKFVDAETEADTQPHTNEVLAGRSKREREEDGIVEQGLAGISSVAEEMVDVIRMRKELTAEQEVAGLSRIAEEMVDVVRGEKESGSIALQPESGATNVSLENEDLQPVPLENCEGQDGVAGMERAEETVTSTETMRNKEIKKVEEPGEWSHTPIGLDADTDKSRKDVNLFQYLKGAPSERANKAVQEMCCETEGNTSDVLPLQHPDVGRTSESRIMEAECHQLLGRNDTIIKEVETEMITKHLASDTNKHVVTALETKEAQVQDLQGSSPAIQAPLDNLTSRNLAFETSHSEGDKRVEWEKQQNRQVHAEMQIRLLPDNSVRADLIKSHEVLEGGSGMKMLKELPFMKSKEAQDEESGAFVGQHWRLGIVMQVKTKADTPMEERPQDTKMREIGFEKHEGWAFQGPGYENAAHDISRSGRAGMFEEEKTGMSDEANTGTSEEEKYLRAGFAKGDIIEKASQKRKLSDSLAFDNGTMNENGQIDNVVKKAKKKTVNVWAKSTTRKGPKKNSKNGAPQNPSTEDSVLLTPVYVNPDKLEDGPDQPIALSKYDKAEKIELSENRLTASSTKGYRMVRATRGVQEGAWFFEIVVEQLGPTGHTRLGWSTQKGDVQAPVGFDSNSYGYRDLDGSKTHVAIREPYGDLYVEGDVIGFYINLPNGAEYAPKPAPLISYRGRPYLSDIKEEQPRRVPGSEICFFRNGVCQGTAFRDINAGRYFPAASMYTLPKEPSCIVRFNFGPEFRFPPVDIGDRTPPLPMVQAPYHDAFSGKEVGTVAWANASAPGIASLNTEPQMKIL